MIGMSATTGEPISGMAHLQQSIADILTTPIGTRVGRRTYGSLLPTLMDQPMNALGRLRLFAATASALAQWEPRLKLTQLTISIQPDGSTALDIEGERVADNGGSDFRIIIPLTPA